MFRIAVFLGCWCAGSMLLGLAHISLCESYRWFKRRRNGSAGQTTAVIAIDQPKIAPKGSPTVQTSKMALRDTKDAFHETRLPGA